MDHAEEQQAEMESLESIYPDSFNKISTNPYYFTIDLIPHPDSNEPNHVNVRLHIKYPPHYPDEMPIITMQSVKGLSPQTIKDLENTAIEICRDHIGMCCIYNVCTQIQEWLVHHNIPFDTSLHEQMTAQQDLKKRLERLTFGEEGKTGDHSTLDTHSIQDFDLSYQRKKGTPVTVESFNQWSEKFIRQYREQKKAKELEEMGPVDDKKDKMTGKQIFVEMSTRNLKDNLDKLEQYDTSSGEEDEEEEKNNPAVVKKEDIVTTVHYEMDENEEEEEEEEIDELAEKDRQYKYPGMEDEENNEREEQNDNNTNNNNNNNNNSNNKNKNKNKNKNTNTNKNANANANTNTKNKDNNNKDNKDNSKNPKNKKDKKNKKSDKTIVVKDGNNTSSRKPNETVIVNDESLFLDLEME